MVSATALEPFVQLSLGPSLILWELEDILLPIIQSSLPHARASQWGAPTQCMHSGAHLLTRVRVHDIVRLALPLASFFLGCEHLVGELLDSFLRIVRFRDL